jgi:hypothetical protein
MSPFGGTNYSRMRQDQSAEFLQGQAEVFQRCSAYVGGRTSGGHMNEAEQDEDESSGELHLGAGQTQKSI